MRTSTRREESTAARFRRRRLASWCSCGAAPGKECGRQPAGGDGTAARSRWRRLVVTWQSSGYSWRTTRTSTRREDVTAVSSRWRLLVVMRQLTGCFSRRTLIPSSTAHARRVYKASAPQPSGVRLGEAHGPYVPPITSRARPPCRVAGHLPEQLPSIN